MRSEADEDQNDQTPRRPKPILAGLAGLAGFGLGYVYVGRARLAVVPLLFYLGLMAVVGWSRLILEPAVFYICAALIVVVFLITIIHPAVIAYRTVENPPKPYNAGWVYVLWIVLMYVLLNTVTDNRHSLFGFEPFRIPSYSMERTLQPGDVILADTWLYRDSSPQINELVVHGLPDDPDIKYLMRVVGLPGDTLELREDTLIRNGLPVEERFVLLFGPTNRSRSDFAPLVVPEDHFFMLGDNRRNSRDSRYIGPIHRDLLHGRVEYRWFAVNDGIDWSRFPERLTPAVE